MLNYIFVIHCLQKINSFLGDEKISTVGFYKIVKKTMWENDNNLGKAQNFYINVNMGWEGGGGETCIWVKFYIKHKATLRNKQFSLCRM